MRTIKRFLETNGIIQVSFNHLQHYPTPINLNYFWNFGSLAGFFLSLQIITGIFLSMFYSTDVTTAFSSVEYIMRNVNYGWFVRYLHANGASFFFAIIYIHIARGIYYKSYNYNNRSVWFSGIGLFILMMATAFIGYVLPWGQMSFWGATVITNLFSAIPVIGSSLVEWIWGGKSVTGITLRRFFTLHYLFSFIIMLFVLVHIANLHVQGSSNPFPEHYRFGKDVVPFYPYFFFKDLLGVLVVVVVLMAFLYLNPNYLGHPDNYIEANPLVTPTHIVPEWYFLPFYAILRSISDKLQGVLCMFAAIVSFLFLPHCNYLFRSLKVKYSTRTIKIIPPILYELMDVPVIHKLFSFLFFSVFLLLGWLGAQPIEYPYLQLGIFLTHIYFFLLIMLAIY